MIEKECGKKKLGFLSCTFYSCQQLILQKIDLEMEGNKAMGIPGTSFSPFLARAESNKKAWRVS